MKCECGKKMKWAAFDKDKNMDYYICPDEECSHHKEVQEVPME